MNIEHILKEHEKWAKDHKQGSQANLSGTSLFECDLRGRNLSGANFSNCDLTKTDLTNSLLIGANFSGSTLMGAKMAKCDLSNANFTDANLRGANLQTCNMSGTNFKSADLFGADLRQCTFDEDTNFKHANLSKSKMDDQAIAKVKEEPVTRNEESMPDETAIVGRDTGLPGDSGSRPGRLIPKGRGRTRKVDKEVVDDVLRPGEKPARVEVPPEPKKKKPKKRVKVK